MTTIQSAAAWPSPASSPPRRSARPRPRRPTRPTAARPSSSASRHRFRLIEERRGYEAASEWWNDHAWPKYYERCEKP